MGLQYPNSLHAGGRVTGTTGSVASGAGFTSARASAGTYNLTLEIPADSAEIWAHVTLQGATSGMTRVVDTSDSVKQVLTFAVDGTTAADRDFNVTFFRAPAQ